MHLFDDSTHQYVHDSGSEDEDEADAGEDEGVMQLGHSVLLEHAIILTLRQECRERKDSFIDCDLLIFQNQEVYEEDGDGDAHDHSSSHVNSSSSINVSGFSRFGAVDPQARSDGRQEHAYDEQRYV